MTIVNITLNQTGPHKHTTVYRFIKINSKKTWQSTDDADLYFRKLIIDVLQKVHSLGITMIFCIPCIQLDFIFFPYLSRMWKSSKPKAINIIPKKTTPFNDYNNPHSQKNSSIGSPPPLKQEQAFELNTESLNNDAFSPLWWERYLHSVPQSFITRSQGNLNPIRENDNDET